MKIREKRIAGPGDDFWASPEFGVTITEISTSENMYGKTVVEETDIATNETVRLLEIERKFKES